MANLIDHKKWAITGGTRKESTFTLINGSMKQSIAVPGDETKYKLEFNCLEIVNPKSYFLFKVVTLGGKHTYLVPVNFLGPKSIEIEFVTDIRTMDIALIGSLTVSDINFCENGTLTQSQKDSISKVESESDKWDRIVDVTNEQGNLIASRLEGSINNALNSIFGGNGTMEIIDGTIMFRDGATDAVSTMAMRINFAGLAIADSKKSDGSWDWKTFGTGQGFTADYMTTGTLSAITIDGVTITATDIVGGKITGAVIDGGTTKEGIIKGYKIIGSTVIAGDEAKGNYISITPNTPFRVYENNKVMIEIYSSSDGGYMSICNINGEELYRVECDSTNRGCVMVTSPFIATETGLFSLRTNGRQEYGRSNNGAILLDASRRGSSVANGGILLKTNDRISREVPDGDIEMYSSGNVFVKVGYSGWQSPNRMTIDGHVYCYGDMTVEGTLTAPTRLSSKNISELEVRNMELEEQLIQEGLARSELEITLMEKGVL